MRPANQRVVENIKRLMKKRGDTAEKVAFGADVAKSTMSRLLSGKLNPTVRLLDKLATYFETDIKAFFE